MSDGNAIFSVTCWNGGSFPSVATCSVSTLLFVAVVRDAIAAPQSCGSYHHSGDGPRGPIKLIGELIVHTAGEPVVGYPGVCNHGVSISLAYLAVALRAPVSLLVTRNLSLCIR